MSYRNIFIENPAKISTRNHQLIIETDNVCSIPVEDISAILIENQRSSITSAALSFIGESGIALYCCDKKHLPCAVLLPFCQHSRELAVLKTQLNSSEPQKKRLWQKIIKSKIINQAICLELNQQTEAAAIIKTLANKVRSGDPENIEATAAMKYFPYLFNENFSRNNDDVINASLDYGYAILRGYIARTLAVYGFQPALGIHHRSELNHFNLADDLIEPFRPIIDLMVSSMDEFRGEEFNSDCKKILFSSLSMEILSGGQHHSLSFAIERLIKSLIRALDDGKSELCLPELTSLKLHTYE